MQSKAHGHVRYFSDIRAIACIAIVVFHTFYCAVRLFQPDGAPYLEAMMVRNALLWAVPCFVMVTGALLLDPSKKIGFKHIANSYLRRVFIALAVCTLIFALFDMAVDGWSGGVLSLAAAWAGNLISGKGWLHMWYLYLLIAIYLMLPIYRLVSSHCTDEELKYILVLYGLFLSLLPTISGLTGQQLGFYIFETTVYPFFLFAGYALHSGRVRMGTAMSWFLFIAGTAIILLTTFAGITSGNQQLIASIGSYSYLPVLMQAAGLFSIMSRTESRPSTVLSAFFAHLDSCSFGIYLFHVLVLYVLYRALGFNPWMSGGIPTLTALAIVVLAITWMLVWVLKKLPGFRVFL